MGHVHDRGYRLLFSHPAMVEDLLRGYFPEPWVEELDFGSLERRPESYVTEALGGRTQDVIWRAKWRDQDLYLYLLIEFQSTVDRAMTLRMLVYLGLLYQDLLRGDGLSAAGRLPPVLPIVLYNGRRPWSAPIDLVDLIESAAPGLEPYVPRLRYVLLDEARQPAVDLDAWPNLVAALFRLEQSETPAEIAGTVGWLARWLQAPEHRSLRQAFVAWLRRVLLPRRVSGTEIPRIDDLEEFHTMLEERVAEWTREWQEEGRRDGEARVLCRQLKLKFGTLPSEVKARIDAADADVLLGWAERILTAEKLDGVFD